MIEIQQKHNNCKSKCKILFIIFIYLPIIHLHYFCFIHLLPSFRLLFFPQSKLFKRKYSDKFCLWFYQESTTWVNSHFWSGCCWTTYCMILVEQLGGHVPNWSWSLLILHSHTLSMVPYMSKISQISNFF